MSLSNSLLSHQRLVTVFLHCLKVRFLGFLPVGRQTTAAELLQRLFSEMELTNIFYSPCSKESGLSKH